MGHQGFGSPQQLEQGFKRFQKHGLIGGAIAGVIASIPVVSILNLCFCLPVAIGAIVGVNMHLKENPGVALTDGEGATLGAIAGGFGGLIAGLFGALISLALSSMLAGIYASIPGGGGLMAGGIMTFVAIPVYIVVMGAFGALYGFLSLQLFFKDRRRV